MFGVIGVMVTAVVVYGPAFAILAHLPKQGKD